MFIGNEFSDGRSLRAIYIDTDLDIMLVREYLHSGHKSKNSTCIEKYHFIHELYIHFQPNT
jgi:hypothetical protein